MGHACNSIIGATIIALFAMTTLAETLAPGTSGIEGTILVSPSRPGPIQERRAECCASAQRAVRGESWQCHGQDLHYYGEGRFQVALPPGHYIIEREGAPPRVGHWHFEADVVAGQMTKVNWTADSGMR